MTVGALALALGVSVRSLQLAFRKHRGCTPTQAIQRARLDLAATRIRARPEASVTEIALGCGFTHLGRFSAAYRHRFGVTPSDDLRRARR